MPSPRPHRQAHVARGLRSLSAALALAFGAGAALSESDPTRVTELREQALAYESGSGVAKDAALAVARYCEAARLGDAISQFNLGWLYANGRGVARDDAQAAFFLRLAADQGIEQAANVLRLMGEPDPVAARPDCMRDPTLVPPPQAEAPAPVPVVAPKPIVALVGKIAPKFRVPQPLVLAIMKAESNFDSEALSPKNAQGLMQLIPETALRFQVGNALDPAQNIRGGVAYLRWLLAYFEGDVSLVAAAYNAGEGTVERYRGVPPYLETRAYVQRILAAVGAAAQPFDTQVVAPSPYLAEIRERQRARIVGR
ncbi:MAG TPA: transglycosylase SLT domain-containing protein [Burkholderiaceae bacterium]|nr:transglycosylase SLT domain-containing protein [Burkholderiaceae bacterium]